MLETIRPATTATDFAAMAALMTVYLDWCRRRYAAHPDFIEQVFNHQSIGDEIGHLAVAYAAPRGRALVAVRGGQVGGMVAWRRTAEEGVCEMKRLFVAEDFKGEGTGRRLCEAIVASAAAEGCRLMRLDTGHLMGEAIALYESLGFRRCPAYHDYPGELMRHLVFMELDLDTKKSPG